MKMFLNRAPKSISASMEDQALLSYLDLWPQNDTADIGFYHMGRAKAMIWNTFGHQEGDSMNLIARPAGRRRRW
jgi:hypothetical protein